ncbi:putative ABC transporter ATP-binding protein YfiB [Halolactibacillus miurensis]|uniref:ABC transporter ATP-binding protein YfiB n=1 Tax=Halolactibacillus miurensis TaxID=306541 RepID=A0A1I6STD5_9BACI|nr:ABC transporter ATP-binding protein [Halolactibacillus miurensis]GEM04220.1 putative ABC transporter ATP-binding protein YfiB [Halolactibacillus miurensis]SFS80128.1 ATP-binding cassette, subfamily B [Halolactibacillus miurensis]
MKTIVKLVAHYPKQILVALLFMLTELATELILPLFMGKIIDSGIRQADLDGTIFWGSLMIGISLFAFLSGIINSFFSAYVSQQVGADLREQVYRKIQQFSFRNLDRFPTSTLITRLTNDVNQLQRFTFMLMRIATRAPLLIIGSAIMALIVDVRLSLVLVITLPVFIIFIVLFIRYGAKLFRQIQRKLDRVNQVMRENLAGMRLIKAYGRQNEERARFHARSNDLKNHTIFTIRLMDLSGPVVTLVMNGAILLILFQARASVLTDQLAVGDVVAILNYAIRMMQAIGVLNWISMAYTRSKASVNRINEVLVEPIDLTSGPNTLTPESTRAHIDFQSVHFRYHASRPDALKAINLTISRGEHVALIGATGSGKTTLMELIPRAYDPTSGEVSLFSQPLPSLTLESIRQHIGYVPQSTQLFSGTVLENLRFGKPDATIEEVIESAKDAAIHETIMTLPAQYETTLGQRGVNLSGGQKQRLAIARALLRRPELLLLDDATSALDLATEGDILRAIKQRQTTLIMVTQKVSTMKQMNRIVLLERGCINANGTHRQLLKTSVLYRTIAVSQHEEVTH